MPKLGYAMDDLNWLTGWYGARCNGDWEHQCGINLTTLDNPGWALTIELDGTDLETCPFERLEIGLMSDTSWIMCFVREKEV